MSTKITVDCDDCKKILNAKEQLFMSVMQLVYREIGIMDKPGDIKQEFISHSEVYQVELCSKHSPQFMEFVKTYFEHKDKIDFLKYVKQYKKVNKKSTKK